MKALKLIICMLAVFAVSATAQTYQQKGVVRMITTSASSPIIPVAGVKVAVGNNVSKATNNNGQFTMQVTKQFQVNGIVGDEYILAYPTKGQEYYVSKNDIPVVVTTKARMEAVSKEVYDKLHSDYNKKIQELQSARDEANAKARELKKSGQDFVKIEQQRDSLQNLLLGYMNNMTEFEERFDVLSEQLAITDYQSLNEKERRVYEMQKNGEWEDLSDFYNNIMKGDMESYLRNAMDLEKREEKRYRLAAKNCEMCFQDALNNIDALRMQNLNDSVSVLFARLTNIRPTWSYLAQAANFEDLIIGNFDKAIDYGKRALAVADNDSLRYTGLNNMAVFSSRNDLCDDALNYSKQALQLGIRLFGEFSEQTLTQYLSLAKEYIKTGNLDLARNNLEEAFLIYENNKNIEKSELANVYCTQARLLKMEDRFSESIEAYKNAINLIEDNNEEEILYYKSCFYSDLGSVLAEAERLSEALEAYQQSLYIQEQILAPNHPDFAALYSNMGNIYYRNSDIDTAIEFYQKALNIEIAMRGEESLAVAGIYGNMALVIADKGDLQKAMEYQLKTLDIRKQYLNVNHPLIGTSYNNIGTLYHQMADYEKAVEFFSRDLDIIRRIHNRPTYDEAKVLYNIGLALLKSKDYESALKHFVPAIEMAKSTIGNQNDLVCNGLYRVSMLYTDLGDYNNAIACLIELKDIYTEIFGEEHGETKYIKTAICGVKQEEAKKLGKKEYAEFLKSHSYIATISPEGEAAKRGLKGDCLWLEYENWNILIEKEVDLMDVMKENSGKPVNAVFYMDGKIFHEHFDGKLGVSTAMCSVPTEKKAAAIKLYNKRKREI